MKVKEYTRNKELIDELDLQILRKLGKDARRSFLSVARDLKVSGATIHERVAKLKEKGILEGFCLRLNTKCLGYQVTAFVGLITTQKKELLQMVDQLKKIKEVEEAHTVTGRYDFLIKLRAQDNEELQKLLTNKIGSIPGVVRHETMIGLTTIFERSMELM